MLNETIVYYLLLMGGKYSSKSGEEVVLSKMLYHVYTFDITDQSISEEIAETYNSIDQIELSENSSLYSKLDTLYNNISTCDMGELYITLVANDDVVIQLAPAPQEHYVIIMHIRGDSTSLVINKSRCIKYIGVIPNVEYLESCLDSAITDYDISKLLEDIRLLSLETLTGFNVSQFGAYLSGDIIEFYPTMDGCTSRIFLEEGSPISSDKLDLVKELLSYYKDCNFVELPTPMAILAHNMIETIIRHGVISHHRNYKLAPVIELSIGGMLYRYYSSQRSNAQAVAAIKGNQCQLLLFEDGVVRYNQVQIINFASFAHPFHQPITVDDVAKECLKNADKLVDVNPFKYLLEVAKETNPYLDLESIFEEVHKGGS